MINKIKKSYWLDKKCTDTVDSVISELKKKHKLKVKESLVVRVAIKRNTVDGLVKAILKIKEYEDDVAQMTRDKRIEEAEQRDRGMAE